MKSLCSIGLGLSVVFTCLLIALVAEIYYLLWWKRRIIQREIEDDYRYSATSRDFFYNFCWKKPASNSANNLTNAQLQQSPTDQEFQYHCQNNNNEDYTLEQRDDTGLGTQLIICPPRFLFTIKEESKEDMESEDGKSLRESNKRNSLNDLLNNVENNGATPYITPLSSPPFVTPSSTPMGSCHSSHSSIGGAYNPFFESCTDTEFNKIVKASPPPKFKFLRDAEEKLQRKSMLIEKPTKEANILAKSNVEEDGSFINIIVAKNKESDIDNDNHYHSPQCHSCCSSLSSCGSQLQVLPLPSSPSVLVPTHRKFKNILTK